MILVSLKLLTLKFIVLFGTNISNEMFEYANATNSDLRTLKELLLRNVEAIFDEGCKQ